ncbi:DUF2218 domain-containing protein [Methylobacterium nodulans]|uniref:DUF2218 domain-containing protein n=1 Tax=Methylobacterium nodulans (strain LMG 21967 / CNCM I-2342 / ORS 2060) TaxID=460265 RepID=B8ILE9_METNO|nr:DUF2218 domain-containing protein [Methylobacterium nodulans]ACL60148.1 conserved hypothetical protein [Methylobacterium nodulans ORS 2060]
MSEPVTLLAEARVETPAASRYLAQLCKHWSHKFPETVFSPERGVVPFGEGRSATFEADAEGLTLRVAAPDLARLTRLEAVVAEHLTRFAARENLGGIAWTRLA